MPVQVCNKLVVSILCRHIEFVCRCVRSSFFVVVLRIQGLLIIVVRTPFLHGKSYSETKLAF